MECDSFDLDFSETQLIPRAYITTERDGYGKLPDLRREMVRRDIIGNNDLFENID